MLPIKRTTRHAALLFMTVLLITCLFSTGAAAADPGILYHTDYKFSAEDFKMCIRDRHSPCALYSLTYRLNDPFLDSLNSQIRIMQAP